VSANESYQNAESLKINLALFNQIRDESIHRWAWRSDREMADFLAEMRPGAAMLERSPEPNTQQPTATEAGEPLMDPACIYPILNRPHLFGNEIELMQRTFEKAGPNYLEFGTGGSTLMAVQRGNTVVSVESDPVWAAGVRAHCEIAEAIAAGRVTILHADVGPVGEFGHPRGRNHIDHWNSYLYLPWNEWSKRGAAPDLVYVDGRFRVACCMSVIMALGQKFASGTMPLVLMHDITDDRPFYKPVFDFFETVEAVESLYLMRVRPDVSCTTALAAMLRHQNDAR
jgi:hypothetical protein